jgi:hypothetical protein
MGYDFMIDQDWRVFLIEANTNPCLEVPCPLLARIINNVLDSTFRIAIDPLFQPQDFSAARRNTSGVEILSENQFELIFDDSVDGPALEELFKKEGEKLHPSQKQIIGIDFISNYLDEMNLEESDNDTDESIEL